MSDPDPDCPDCEGTGQVVTTTPMEPADETGFVPHMREVRPCSCRFQAVIGFLRCADCGFEGRVIFAPDEEPLCPACDGGEQTIAGAARQVAKAAKDVARALGPALAPALALARWLGKLGSKRRKPPHADD